MEENIYHSDEKSVPSEDQPVLPQAAEESLNNGFDTDKGSIPFDEANNDLLIPDENAILEGQFEEIPAEELAKEEPKPRLKPAFLTAIIILTLIVLCLIMGLIIFVMILPDIRADHELGAALLSFCYPLYSV